MPSMAVGGVGGIIKMPEIAPGRAVAGFSKRPPYEGKGETGKSFLGPI